jgi:hypothetical protein
VKEKKLMLKYLDKWCNSQLIRRGKLCAICIHLPRKHGLNQSWCEFWCEIDKTEIGCVENRFSFSGDHKDYKEIVSISRMLLLHDFVDWLYE